MNIKILDSWLRDYLNTTTSANEIAKNLSLTSVSVERLEKNGEDFIYDIEVTTNRPDLMSVAGIAREAAAVLPQSGIKAEFSELKLEPVKNTAKLEIEIKNDPKLVNRICAVALEVKLGKSPKKITDRLEASDIRSLNNVIDVTNYVMREIGHPMHVFDLDRLTTKKLIIREAKKGENLITLDEKKHILSGGEIVADNGTGKIIDLLGIMGTQNSVVTDATKRVLLFIDNNDPIRIRRASMGLGIRSEAAIINEKNVDPEKGMEAILRGVELLKEIAGGKVISEIVDIYPNKPKIVSISVDEDKINSVIGIQIPLKTSAKILTSLGFGVVLKGNGIRAEVPSWRLGDVGIEEDLIEEIARVFGYHNLPSRLPGFETGEPFNLEGSPFYWEAKAKNALKYWGFTEVYTYSMVSEDLLEVRPAAAVKIKNPLSLDRVYMRTTLVPSLLESARDNKNRDELKIFELANVYIKKENNLPSEKLRLAGIYKKAKSKNERIFFEAKGITEALFEDLGISDYEFKKTGSGALGADVYIKGKNAGQIEMLDHEIVDFELDFELILAAAALKKAYNPVSKFPQSTEDLRFEIDPSIPYEKIVRTITKQSGLIKEVSLLDVYQNKKTFRIIYQSFEENITLEKLGEVREKIISTLKENFKAEPA